MVTKRESRGAVYLSASDGINDREDTMQVYIEDIRHVVSWDDVVTGIYRARKWKQRR